MRQAFLRLGGQRFVFQPHVFLPCAFVEAHLGIAGYVLEVEAQQAAFARGAAVAEDVFVGRDAGGVGAAQRVEIEVVRARDVASEVVLVSTARIENDGALIGGGRDDADVGKCGNAAQEYSGEEGELDGVFREDGG